MDDHEVLQHLLSLENKSATLVDDAQTEADRRIAQAETENRKRYDEAYAAEAAIQEQTYTRSIEAVREDYRKQLELYCENLKAMPHNAGAFSALAEKLLFSGER